MIKVKIDLELRDNATKYFNSKKKYFLGIKIYENIINSNLPIDISNCYPENQQPKMGFNKK